MQSQMSLRSLIKAEIYEVCQFKTQMSAVQKLCHMSCYVLLLKVVLLVLSVTAVFLFDLDLH